MAMNKWTWEEQTVLTSTKCSNPAGDDFRIGIFKETETYCLYKNNKEAILYSQDIGDIINTLKSENVTTIKNPYSDGNDAKTKKCADMIVSGFTARLKNTDNTLLS